MTTENRHELPDNDPAQWLLNVREYGIEEANRLSDNADSYDNADRHARARFAKMAEALRSKEVS